MTRVVITSTGVLCALGRDLAELRRAWHAGESGIRPVTCTGEPWLPWPEGGEIPDIRARDLLHKKQRKHVKVMARPVWLGVGAARAAWQHRIGAAEGGVLPHPERRGAFVGAGMHVDEGGDFVEPMKRAYSDGRFQLDQWARAGIPALNPLWLIKGLSNNVLAFVSLFEDLQGVNDNFCEGEGAGVIAVGEALRGLQARQCDIALAGGYGTYLTLEDMVGQDLLETRSADWRPGEGAAFFVMERASDASTAGQQPLATVEGFGSCLPGGDSLAMACADAQLEPDQIDRQIEDISPRLGNTHGGHGALMMAIALGYPGERVAITAGDPHQTSASVILRVHA